MGAVLSCAAHYFILRLVIEESAEKPKTISYYEVVPESARISGKGNTKGRISARSLSLSGGKGVRLGAYSIDPTTPLSGVGEAPLEFGTPEGLTNAKGERYAVPEKTLKYSGFLSRMHAFIDSSLSYPREFVENDIQGKVEVTLRFDQNGLILKEGGIRAKSKSHYLMLWSKKHFAALFKNPLSFAIGKPFKIVVVVELEQGSGFVYGNFAQDDDSLNRTFSRSEIFYTPDHTGKTTLSDGRLFFYRQAAKQMGVGVTGTKGMGLAGIMPVLDLFSLVDRVSRALDLSEDKVHEKNMLEIYRNDPAWGKN